jgi:DNA topoisomerase-1
MEKLKIGTPATRDIELDILFRRGYVKGRRRIVVTELGRLVIETLKELLEEITMPTMTAKMEEELDKIEYGKVRPSAFMEEVKLSILNAMEKFRSKEEEIGQKLASGLSKGVS